MEENLEQNIEEIKEIIDNTNTSDSEVLKKTNSEKVIIRIKKFCSKVVIKNEINTPEKP